MFIKKIQPLIGKPFIEGGYDIKGCDCLGLIYYIQTNALKKSMPKEYKSYDDKNYVDLYKDNHEKAIELMYEYFDSFAKRVDIKYLSVGDIVCCIAENNKFAGVYVGNNQILSSIPNIGVRPLSIGIKIKVIDAWRIE